MVIAPLRAKHDAASRREVQRVFEENFCGYGVKVWHQLQREGFQVARCMVARLIRDTGLAGVIRGKPVRTTVSDKAAPCSSGAVVGSLGDSYGNALAGTINGLYKAKVIHRCGPRRSLEAVECATLEWLDWFNNRRLPDKLRRPAYKPTARGSGYKASPARRSGCHAASAQTTTGRTTWECGG